MIMMLFAIKQIKERRIKLIQGIVLGTTDCTMQPVAVHPFRIVYITGAAGRPREQ